MTKREREKLKKTAYHEAGHAVANFAMGKRFKKVSIISDPEQNTLGEVTGCHWRSKFNPELDEGRRTRRLVEVEIITSLAGPVAEAKLTGRYNHIGASEDYQDVVFYTGFSKVADSDQEAEAYIKWLLEKTKNILSHRWEAVELLADELITQREIGYIKARKIIRNGIDGPLPPLDTKKFMTKKTGP